ncbi:MAG: hypothetical protein ACOX47_10475 [Bacillota bacterium]|jgi:uncharacterized protein YoxC
MYISLQDFCLIILVMIALSVGIYLLITLKNLNRLLTMAGDFFKRHHENLDKSIQQLPETIKDTREMTNSIKHQVDEVGTSFSSLGVGLSETVATINDKTDTGLALIKGVGEVLQVLVDIFRKTK